MEGSILIIYVRFSGGEGVIYSTLLSLNLYILEMIETKPGRKPSYKTKLQVVYCKHSSVSPPLIPQTRLDQSWI